jgi:LTXXQ motif family protein
MLERTIHSFRLKTSSLSQDARIASLKTGLKLRPAQEKNWPALETALREQAKAHAARAAEWREKAGEPHERRDVIEGLRQRR